MGIFEKKKKIKILEEVEKCIVDIFKTKILGIIDEYIKQLEKYEQRHIQKGEGREAIYFSMCISEIKVLKTLIENELNKI